MRNGGRRDVWLGVTLLALLTLAIARPVLGISVNGLGGISFDNVASSATSGLRHGGRAADGETLQAPDTEEQKPDAPKPEGAQRAGDGAKPNAEAPKSGDGAGADGAAPAGLEGATPTDELRKLLGAEGGEVDTKLLDLAQTLTANPKAIDKLLGTENPTGVEAYRKALLSDPAQLEKLQKQIELAAKGPLTSEQREKLGELGERLAARLTEVRNQNEAVANSDRLTGDGKGEPKAPPGKLTDAAASKDGDSKEQSWTSWLWGKVSDLFASSDKSAPSGDGAGGEAKSSGGGDAGAAKGPGGNGDGSGAASLPVVGEGGAGASGGTSSDTGSSTTTSTTDSAGSHSTSTIPDGTASTLPGSPVLGTGSATDVSSQPSLSLPSGWTSVSFGPTGAGTGSVGGTSGTAASAGSGGAALSARGPASVGRPLPSTSSSDDEDSVSGASESVVTIPRRPAGVAGGGDGGVSVALPPIAKNVAPPPRPGGAAGGGAIGGTSGGIATGSASSETPASAAPSGFTGTFVVARAPDSGGSSGGSVLASTGLGAPSWLGGNNAPKADTPKVNLLTGNDLSPVGVGSSGTPASGGSGQGTVPGAGTTYGPAFGPQLPWKNEPPVAAAGPAGATVAAVASSSASSANGTPWTDTNDTRRIERAAASASKPLIAVAATRDEGETVSPPSSGAGVRGAKATPPKAIAGELAEDEEIVAEGKDIRITALAAPGVGAEPKGPIVRNGPKSRAVTKAAYKQPAAAKALVSAPAPVAPPGPLSFAKVPEPAAPGPRVRGSDLSRFRESAPKK